MDAVTDSKRARSPVHRQGTRDSERTQAAILTAATREFARHGLGGESVDRIAAGARATKQMLYYY